MDFLEKCRKLLQEIEDSAKELDEIEARLQENDVSENEYERLYGRQFHLSIIASGAFSDLEKITEEMKKDDNLKFIANRFMKRAEEYVKVEVINVNNNI